MRLGCLAAACVLGLPELAAAQAGVSPDLRSYAHPAPGPAIGWEHAGSRFEPITYGVCGDGAAPRTFYWTRAKFGAAHECLVGPGACVRKTDAMSSARLGYPESFAAGTGIFASRFQLDGSPIAGGVPTRVWCAQGAEAPCEPAGPGFWVRSSLTLERRPESCGFAGVPPEPGTPDEIAVAAILQGERWQIEVISRVDAAITVAFLGAQAGDLIVSGPSGALVLAPLELGAMLAGFGPEPPPDLRAPGLVGVALSTAEAPFATELTVKNLRSAGFRPVLLASASGKVFAILGLGSLLR